MTTRKQKFTFILHLFTIITLVFSFLFFCLIGYWMFYPVEVITYEHPESIQVDKAVYKAGERISYTLEYCKKYDTQGKVSRVLVNGTRTNFTEYITNLPTGCNKTLVNDMIIPAYLDRGLYHIETTAVYKINPISDFVGTWKSVEFEIIDSNCTKDCYE